MTYEERKPTAYAKLGTSVYGTAQVADIATTYLLSPNLKFEANLLVQKLELGWPGLIAMAILSILVMHFVQKWMWTRLFQRLPRTQSSYKSLYRSLLRATTTSSSSTGSKSDFIGIMLGVAFIAAYAAIVSKLITTTSNTSFLLLGTTYQAPVGLRLVRSVTGIVAGMFMFFVVPFWIHRRRWKCEH